MKYYSLALLFSLFLLGSCSTAYRNMQTPDDVYYSDGRPEGALVAESEPEYPSRMKCRDRRWRDINDDFGYGYDPYHYGYCHPYYYNPYYYPFPVFNYIPAPNSTPRYSNLAGYYNNTRTIVNTKTGETSILKSSEAYNNSNRDSRLIRSAGSGASGDSRIYSPSKTSSGSASGQPISRPSRN